MRLFRSPWLWFSLALVYVAVAFLPWTAVEGDDIGIAAGALQLALEGNLQFGFDYRYDFQPATYRLVAVLRRFAGVPPLAGFGLLTVVGFVLFFGSSVLLVAERTGISLPWAGLSLLLIQETYVSAYYANSSMIAAGLLMAASVLAGRRSLVMVVAAGGVFALAVLARFDAVLMAPAVFLLTLRKDQPSLSRTAALGAAAAAVLAVPAAMGDVSPLRIWQERTVHARQFVSIAQTSMSYLTLVSGVGCLLALVGVRVCFRERNWRLIAIVVAGCLPLMFAYGLAVTTPKYLLYAVPFFTLLVARGLQWTLADRSRAGSWIRVACAGLFVVQYALGPLTLTSWALGRNVVVVGTHDGLRRLDAIAYVPVMWLRTKLRYADGLERAEHVLRETPANSRRALLLTADWFSSKWVAYELLRDGYRCVESYRHFEHIPIVTEHDFHVYRKAGREITTFQVDWLDGPLPAEDWRKRVSLDGYDAILLFGRHDPPEELLGSPVSGEPLPGLSGFDRLPVFRILPAADSPPRGEESADRPETPS